MRRAAIKQKRELVLFYFYFSFIAVVRAALLCLKTLINIPSFLVKKTLLLHQPNASQKCTQHYVVIRNTSCSKYVNRYFPYWKILFLSSIFLKAVAQKLCGGFY